MTTGTLFAVFADFNELKDDPAPPLEEGSVLLEEVGQVREAAWTNGYLTGCHALSGENDDPKLMARLLTSLDELDSKMTEAIDAASLEVADLLINTVIAVVSDDWPAKLLSRVRMVADRIKPALTVTPEFVLRDDVGTERRFGDISGLSRAMEDGIVGEDVTIRWQRGEATISRKALLEDLREAIVPLSAGLVNEKNARHQT